MAFSKPIFILATLGAIGALGVGGCGEDDPVHGGPPGTGGTGTGGAGGTGTGEGGTTGTGGATIDTTPLPGVRLMPNSEGFMKTGDNALGIQGAWYSFGCVGAVLEPAEGSRFDNPGKMCFKGTAPMVTDQDGDGALDYSTIWGAGIGFDLCAQSEEEAADAGVSDDAGKIVPTKYPLMSCPYNAELATKLIGVAVRFSGVVNATELRIQFNEGDTSRTPTTRLPPRTWRQAPSCTSSSRTRWSRPTTTPSSSPATRMPTTFWRSSSWFPPTTPPRSTGTSASKTSLPSPRPDGVPFERHYALADKTGFQQHPLISSWKDSHDY